MNATALATRWQVFANTAALADRAAGLILDAAREAIAARGMCRLVLAGGDTPKETYARLRAAEANWAKWQIYFGDERCLPRGDPRRNDTMAHHTWLDQIDIPAANIHSIAAEHGAQQGARRYAKILRHVPMFDLVLLGLGEDGHTASLFPGQQAGLDENHADVLAVYAAPKPPPERVSLSAARLSRTWRALFVVGGKAKRDAVQAWRAQADIPARHISPALGVDVYVDRAAWPDA